MKSKALFVLAVIIALIIGFFVGRFQGGRSVSKFVEHSIINLGAANETQQAVRILTYLKEGRSTNAFDLLEMKLDHSLLTISHAEELTPEMREAIGVAREYRTKHPWNSHPELQSRIDQVLSLGK